MKDYLLIIKGGMNDASPEEMQQAMHDYMSWAQELGDQYIDGQRLEKEGKLLEGDNVMTDGPFLEPKEIIAGYIIVKANDLDEAATIAKGCSLMEHCQIEVRPILALPN